MPSGYASDPVIVRTEAYLLAAGQLTRERSDLLAPAGGPLLRLAARIHEERLFEEERSVLEQLSSIRITKKSLGDYR